MSRAIGDFEFKQNYSLPPEEQVVTVNPEILVHDLTPDDEFIVIACDGESHCSLSFLCTLRPSHVVRLFFHQVSGTACRHRL